MPARHEGICPVLNDSFLVDTLVKTAAERTYEQIDELVGAVGSRLDELDMLRSQFPDDVRIEKPLTRLRDLRMELAKKRKSRVFEYVINTLSNGNGVNSRPKNIKETTESPSKSVKALYRWETRQSAWLRTQRDVNYVALKEPGHYSTKNPVENTLEIEGSFEFQIIMTQEEWRWHQQQRRRVVAESKHLERTKKAGDASSHSERSLQSSTPYIDPIKVEKSVYR
ncbi:hypothetical protein Ae201684P_013019 [Aphanomyces euteiches]|nr:hypothetical protein Ae201684P_013019 [Aphanomyces euteiches]KAH9157516.1 hypothetical protein AeRB84_000618 [Aphanomyces euteiches]